MNGTISGGWEYVWAAYGITAVVLLGYAASLVARLRAERRRVALEAAVRLAPKVSSAPQPVVAVTTDASMATPQGGRR